MDRYQYRVVPTPLKKRSLGSAGDEGVRFAAMLEATMNEFGAQGWHYVRADTMPSEERVGFASRQTVLQNVLIFRRLIPGPAAANLPDVVRAGATSHEAARKTSVPPPAADAEEAALMLENPVAPEPTAPAVESDREEIAQQSPYTPPAPKRQSIDKLVRDLMPTHPMAPRIVNPALAVRAAQRRARKIAAE